jgi:chromosome segregation ATPase
VEAAAIPWRLLGEVLLARGLISGPELEQALAQQAETGKRLGDILVADGMISSPDLTDALMEQLGQELVKEAGFGSGLWTQIRKRHPRADAAAPRALREEEPRTLNSQSAQSDTSELAVIRDREPSTESLADTAELDRQADDVPDPDRDLEELKLELELEAHRSDRDSGNGAHEPSADEPDRTPPDADGSARSEAQLTSLQADIQDLEQERARLQGITADLEIRVTETERRLAAARAQLEAREVSLHDQQATLAQLQSEQAERELAVEQLRARAGDADRLEAELIERDRRAGELETLHEQMLERCHFAETDLDESRAQTEQTERELAAARAALQTRETSLEEQRATLEQARDQYRLERAAHADTRDRLSEALGVMSTSASKLQHVEARLEAAEGELAEIRARRGEPAPEIRAQLEDAVAFLLFARNEYEQMDARLASTETSLAREKAEHANTRRCLKQLSDVLRKFSAPEVSDEDSCGQGHDGATLVPHEADSRL